MIIKLNHQAWDEPSWSMEINLQALCEMVGKKEEVEKGGKWVKVAAYPVSKLRKLLKLLKLIFQECSADEVEQVLNYFKKHNKTCAAELEKICEKGR